MPFTMSQSAIPVVRIELGALSAILDKADAFAREKGIEPSVLLGWRLAPDMYPLTRQVQIATDLAKNGLARLAEVEPPKYADDETTIEALRSRLAKAVAYVDTLDTTRIDAAADRTVSFPLGGKTGTMKGADYLTHFVLPNIYFHVTTAYAILRRCGVQIGKQDFVGAIPLTIA